MYAYKFCFEISNLLKIELNLYFLKHLIYLIEYEYIHRFKKNRVIKNITFILTHSIRLHR